MLRRLIDDVRSGRDLSTDEMEAAITLMLRENAAADKAPVKSPAEQTSSEVSELLLALREKGESVSELVGAAMALRKAMLPIATNRSDLLDTCGTGGDGAKTFNISTAAAIVAAAAGASVAKHGNRKVTSFTGSADVLNELGIKIDAPRHIVELCLDKVGIGFCFAPLLHPAMRHVSEIRKQIGVPTLFNYLGPLCNPAGAVFQLLGCGKESLQTKIALALRELPIQRALVVRGLDGLDEITLMDQTSVILIDNTKSNSSEAYSTRLWQPETFGKKKIAVEELVVEDAIQSAAVIRSILTGKRGGARDIVVCNAAAALWLSDSKLFPMREQGIALAVDRCESAIDRGDAERTLGTTRRTLSTRITGDKQKYEKTWMLHNIQVFLRFAVRLLLSTN